MSSYTDHFGAIIIEGTRYRLTSSLIWHIGHVEGPTYIVFEGTEFDLSIPRGLRWLFDPHRREYLKAAALHDSFLADGWSRITAGAEFHNALKADGVSRWRRLVMWAAVSLYRYD